jgi:phosphatidylinositol alpha-1,6-mannosyltransferase
MPTLLISEVLPPRIGGSGRWLWNVYESLPREEYVLAAGEDSRQGEFDRTHDRRVVRLPLSFPDVGLASAAGLRAHWRALRALRRIVREEGVGQVHAGRCLPEGWLALLLRRCDGLPYLCYAHGEELNLVPRGGPGGPMSSRQLRWMTWAVLRGAMGVIANSRSTACLLEEQWRLPAGRIRVLHPGVDIHRFVPAASDGSVRARLGWQGRHVVLTVGRLQERKGHDRMIRALSKIRGAVPDVLYAIVGDGEERSRLGDLALREGVSSHVQFLGELAEDDLLHCYQQCDLFVLPNRQVGRDLEGFGIVLLEAQACGKPVMAGDSGGTAETMRVPETGHVVQCDDPGELARWTVKLLADDALRACMGSAARRWTVERFDRAQLGASAQRLFREVWDDGRQ